MQDPPVNPPSEDRSDGLQGDRPQAPPNDFSIDQKKPVDPRDFPNPPGITSRRTPTTLPNVIYLLKRYGIKINYDVIKKRLRHHIPGLKIAPDNADNVALTEITSLCVLNELQPGLIPAYIDAIADRYQINPVKEWIESKPWDGIDRLAAIQNTLTVREDFPLGLRDLLVYKWLLSAVAAATLDGSYRGRGVLTLQGDQSIGKTAWVLSLVPEELRGELLKIDHHLDPSSKDSVLSAIGHWIVEIGELDSSLKKDVARLKGVLTSPSDKVRRPYAKADSDYPRRTVFCATVNQANFLVDMSGNSRWWTLPVTSIDFNHKIDMQQLYAQLALDVKAGKPWWLSRKEEDWLDEQNAAHLAVSVIRERMQAHLEEVKQSPTNFEDQRVKAIDVLALLGFDQPSNAQAKECAEVLRELLGPSKRINGANKWTIPVSKDKLYGR